MVLTPSRQASRQAGNMKSFVHMYLSLLLTQYSHGLLIGRRFTQSHERYLRKTQLGKKRRYQLDAPCNIEQAPGQGQEDTALHTPWV